MAISLDAIGIVTSNMEKSLEFYSLLGVDVPKSLDDHVEARLSSGIRLMWDTVELVRQIDPNWQTPVGQRIGLAFHCGTATGVDEVFGAVTDAGFSAAKQPWDAFWGQRYAQVIDPDGNIVDLFAPLD